MPHSIPTLCGSLAGQPFTFNVKVHNAAYRVLGVDYTFVSFGVEDIAGAVNAMRTLGIRGLNVTMPHKQAVIPYLDALDETARAIGAVNTIDNRDGRLTGYNTDCVGAVRALEEATPLDGRRIALLGAGGAARAIAWGMQRAGARASVFNRTESRGQALADDFGLAFGGDLGAFDPAAFDGVVNATTAGFRAPDVNPLRAQQLAPHLFVMDAAFIPVRTKLIRDAAALGCRVVDGTRMLLHQFCGQVELYTGKAAPLDAMSTALLDEIARVG
ncbi:shikimate dehydrogenase family protein [Paraburkholderia silvatlantica]|uniref:Shikimate dehydrogenase (NADP(+)) n=1 Tax=Paraburkholderia silvatlantica TaxID=321895 RepID=A0ABR6FSP5_9BURK|nr:shikimate dehydrogenase [Paraburkholderia silvatlantica]MBB2930428.1 shikimate dehydrogenase [Paraburkholderia silvatlantica]PVY17913.1 shikimate dehydrogenase [Paraburkholderia silvatlantica]PXW23833.1 shikimate dehydrogenase [Paraburkholderia silvatlantica]